MRKLTCLLLLLILAGCVTPVINPERVDHPTAMTGMRPLPVHAYPALYERVDRVTVHGLPDYNYQTGHALIGLLTGGKNSPLFSIKESKVEVFFENMGFTARLTYYVQAVMRKNGQDIALEAHATHIVRGFEAPQTSVKIAVDQGLADIFAQVRKLLVLSEPEKPAT